MIRLRYFHRRRYDTRPNSRPRYTVTWYQLKPGQGIFEPEFEEGHRYASIEGEAADGFARLWLNGWRLVVDVTHFERVASTHLNEGMAK